MNERDILGLQSMHVAHHLGLRVEGIEDTLLQVVVILSRDILLNRLDS